MNLNDTKTLTPLRRRSTSLGLIVAAVLLGSTLSACGGNDVENLTCGEMQDLSGDEFFDKIKEAAEDDGSDEAKEVADALEAVPEDQRDATKDAAYQSVCDGEDEDHEPFKE